MYSNIEISTINQNLFPKLKKIDQQINNRTKIKDLSFYSKNEATISDKIRNIPYYSNNYLIVEDCDFLNIGQLNDKFIEKLNLMNDKKYMIFKYKNDNIINFNDFLFHFIDPKKIVFHSIESFSYILNSLIDLNHINICFFNLCPQNIVFNFDCGEKPQIRNFQQSLQISKLNEKYITNIIKKTTDYTHKPLEVHILFYLIQNDISTISYSFIEEICEVFVDNLTVLAFFSEKYKESYKLSCMESLKKYINIPKCDIISDILKQTEKWDVYSLSMLYLHIFANISRFFSLKSTFLNKISIELSKNIHPEPLKRSSLNLLAENYEKLLNEEKDWSYINKLKGNKIQELFDLLGK